MRPGTKVRRSETTAEWGPQRGTVDSAAFEGCEAVIHLAGEGIGERRWTPAPRSPHSKAAPSVLLCSPCVSEMSQPPRVFLSGSAIGYGRRPEARQSTRPVPRFRFCCGSMRGVGARCGGCCLCMCNIRTTFLLAGIVLGAHGGVLKRMLLPFRLGLGGRSGTGRQWMSWISLRDEVGAILFLLDHDVRPGALRPPLQRRTWVEFAHAPRSSAPPAGGAAYAKTAALRQVRQGRVDTLMYSSDAWYRRHSCHTDFTFRTPRSKNASAMR